MTRGLSSLCLVPRLLMVLLMGVQLLFRVQKVPMLCFFMEKLERSWVMLTQISSKTTWPLSLLMGVSLLLQLSLLMLRSGKLCTQKMVQ
nr:hypothetical protein Iba_chr09aCG1210 [Ipomoea batatas]GMD33165.1 hypothetical protein Iba_chr09cCG0080 [Ipomoea batatas]GMD36507.1 hypothetical protein Iba_chr09eCG0640 [Ipomoea batatas]